MNYRQQAAAVRERRNREVKRARDRARAELAALRDDRDELIRRLRADGMSWEAIAVEVGCTRSQTYEATNPDVRERYNARRRARWHVYKGGKAA